MSLTMMIDGEDDNANDEELQWTSTSMASIIMTVTDGEIDKNGKAMKIGT